MLDLNGEMMSGAGARCEHRVTFESFFQCEIRDEFANGHFLFYTNKSAAAWSDDDIRAYIKSKAPYAVLPRAFDVPAVHRWNGIDHVFSAATLLCGTLDLMASCVPQWLGKEAPLKIGHALVQSLDSGYIDHASSKTAIAPVEATLLNTEDKNSDAPANPTAEWYAARRSDSHTLSQPRPLPQLMSNTIMGRHMSLGLKTKLFRAGERWAEQNDIQTASGGIRRYRIVDESSNETEGVAAKSALYLFRTASAWHAIPPSLRTVSTRSYCTRSLTKQVGALILNCTSVHEDNPYTMFYIGLGASKEEKKNTPNFASAYMTMGWNIGSINIQAMSLLVTRALP